MSLYNTLKPTGGVSVQRVMDPPEPNDYLLKWILSRTNMRKAWKHVNTNAGAPGVDGVSVDKFPVEARKSWHETLQKLQTANYHPWPVKRVYIDKPTGGLRPLGIPKESLQSLRAHARSRAFFCSVIIFYLELV